MLNKGFTLTEVLIVIIIMTLFTRLAVSNHNDYDLTTLIATTDLSNKLVSLQIESLSSREKNCLNDSSIIASYPICYNASGNINMSQKISVLSNDLSITIFLGAGKHEIKKR